MITNDAIEYLKTILPFSGRAIEEAYAAGYDCGKNGATIQNCHFTLFSSPHHTKAWEEGKKAGEAAQKK